MTIKIYYTEQQIGDIDEADLRACWANEDEDGDPPQYYLQCDPSYVVTDDQPDINGHDYSGYIVAIIRDNNTTSPRMDQLTGTTFGGYGSGEDPPTQGGCGLATLADITPFVLVSVGIVAVWATKRKGKVFIV